jgi:hypothetical protein
MIRAAWFRKERTAHLRALGEAQAFPLTGDGDRTRGVHFGGDAIAMAEARYRDWLAADRRMTRAEADSYLASTRRPASE